MSYLDGKNPTISVGDTGVIRVPTYVDQTGATARAIKIYTVAEFEGDDASPTPLAVLVAREVTDTPGAPLWEIECDNPGTVFPSEGEYILRSYMEWGAAQTVHGTPVRLFVTRGSA